MKGSDRASSKPDLYVIARIIYTLREQGNLKRTRLATLTGLSYESLTRYLEWMNDKGFLKNSVEGEVTLTEEGHKVYESLVKWILKNIGQLRFPRF